MTDAKILIIDIETSPGLADVWKMWDNNISLDQLKEVTRVICFAAKWAGKPGVIFKSEFHHGREAMIGEAYRLLDDADVVVHYNGTSFDVPHLHREFLLAGMAPPSPFLQVDLLKVARRRFRFMSNKLDHIADQIGLGRKTSHGGHSLWVKCLSGDEAAWKLMRKYNKNDVVLTEGVYDRFLPWIPNHPHLGLITGAVGDTCGGCGGGNLQRRGLKHTAISSFQQYVCLDCHTWSRGKTAISRVDMRSAA